MRILITGGGTGGHVYPGLAVAEALRRLEPGVDFLFVGGRGIEQRIVPQTGMRFAPVLSRSWPRRPTLRWLPAVALLGAGTAQAVGLLLRFRPDVVLATGGYVSIPAGVAGALLRVPLVVQEQNAIPGATNRLLGRWARAVSIPHESVAPFFRGKSIVTGVPVREHALRGDRSRGLRRFGLRDGVLTVLVLGGSLGARALNETVVEMARLLPKESGVQILHQTGPDHDEWVREQIRPPGPMPTYVVMPYIEDVGDAYACADIVISRAGAGTLAEVTANGLPAIAIPYPFAVAGEQEANARMLEAAGAAVVILHRDLNGSRLRDTLVELRDPSRRSAMADASRRLGRPLAAHAVGEIVLRLARA
ncbi:MAG TPA: undecaprenyldiphospho-muramoylpentapeptide beta-N-acetylglucosaminyltransferase [bacterium]|nr:undecaprenyldiphospho-muramoylpentapeptide beta-N-acetylglucosaminyltransferase [bacterium]